MGIDVQGESRREEAQHAGDSFDVHAIFTEIGRRKYGGVMVFDLMNANSFQRAHEHIVHAVSTDGAAIGRGQYI